MATTISKASLLLSADGSQLDAGLDTAQNRIKGFAKNAEVTTKNLSDNVNKNIAAAKPKFNVPTLPSPKLNIPKLGNVPVPASLLKFALPVAGIAAGVVALKSLGDAFVEVADSAR